MSTLRTNTLSNAAGSASVPVDTVINGSAKAWVNFNGTGTVTIRASFNVSSITDVGVGLYQANFTAALPDANYAVSVNGAGDRDASGGFSGFTIRSPSVNNTGAASLTTTSVQVALKNQSGTLLDADVAAIVIFR